ncbi:MAG: hypothetical protein HZB52_08470 [Chloroflexi bacterium]|nr:hypothetical protein [Chloroflexota bacterium]
MTHTEQHQTSEVLKTSEVFNKFDRALTHALKFLGWTRSSYYLMSAFTSMLFVIAYVWWPLVVDYLNTVDVNKPLWIQVDWLLFGIFGVMSLLIMWRADIRSDGVIVAVGFVGGLVIESWGTQTHLWTYYTLERPPLWIIPAWPIASLSIDRLYKFLDFVLGARKESHEELKNTKNYHLLFTVLYWLIFPLFYVLMLRFVAPTFDKSLTLAALFLCAFLILTPTDSRGAVLTFIAGAGLGYFLELWGTTRLCWTYYTREMPPLFAVLAHGMAAVAFWRTALIVRIFLQKISSLISLPLRKPLDQI